MTSRKKEKTEADIMMERLKLEIAEELGLLDKINRGGWGELNGVESGRVGGILSSRLKKSLK
ncbi:MAG: hypothetical protein VR68_02310 [Peptococcaceae bacterium BRH_c4a]|nr:MAG: hypothetical protein VR68_02310 [Peptococcaceae bacterium BRH_c4a]